MNKFKSVFFDLDGTLIDTAPDMALALNTLLIQESKQPLDFQVIRPHVSHGSAGLIKLGFNLQSPHKDYERLRLLFLSLYEKNLVIDSCLFERMDQVLDKLELAGIPWGIVTNKPGYLTNQLLNQLKLEKRAACVISGDTLSVRKPHPQPLLTACEKVNVDPKHCLYVGDALRDIQAAKSAGMRSCSALYGYYTNSEDPQTWQADFEISSADQLLNIIHLDNNPKNLSSSKRGLK